MKRVIRVLKLELADNKVMDDGIETEFMVFDDDTILTPKKFWYNPVTTEVLRGQSKSSIHLTESLSFMLNTAITLNLAMSIKANGDKKEKLNTYMLCKTPVVKRMYAEYIKFSKTLLDKGVQLFSINILRNQVLKEIKYNTGLTISHNFEEMLDDSEDLKPDTKEVVKELLNKMMKPGLKEVGNGEYSHYDVVEKLYNKTIKILNRNFKLLEGMGYKIVDLDLIELPNSGDFDLIQLDNMDPFAEGVSKNKIKKEEDFDDSLSNIFATKKKAVAFKYKDDDVWEDEKPKSKSSWGDEEAEETVNSKVERDAFGRVISGVNKIKKIKKKSKWDDEDDDDSGFMKKFKQDDEDFGGRRRRRRKTNKRNRW